MKKTKQQTKMSVAQCFFQCAKIGAKNKQELVKNMLEMLNKYNITKTQKGTAINKQMCQRQTNAIIRDVRNKRGRWKDIEIVQSKNLFQIINKK